MALQSPTDQAEILTRVLAKAIYGSDHNPIDRFLMGNTPSFNCDGAQYAALQGRRAEAADDLSPGGRGAHRQSQGCLKRIKPADPFRSRRASRAFGSV